MFTNNLRYCENARKKSGGWVRGVQGRCVRRNEVIVKMQKSGGRGRGRSGRRRVRVDAML